MKDEGWTYGYEELLQSRCLGAQPSLGPELIGICPPDILGAMQNPWIDRKGSAFWKITTANLDATFWCYPRQSHFMIVSSNPKEEPWWLNKEFLEGGLTGDRAMNSQSFFDAGLKIIKLLSISLRNDLVQARPLSLRLEYLSSSCLPSPRVTDHMVYGTL